MKIRKKYPTPCGILMEQLCSWTFSDAILITPTINQNVKISNITTTINFQRADTQSKVDFFKHFLYLWCKESKDKQTYQSEMARQIKAKWGEFIKICFFKKCCKSMHKLSQIFIPETFYFLKNVCPSQKSP